MKKRRRAIQEDWLVHVCIEGSERSGGIDGIVIHLLSTSVMVTVASAGSTVTSLPLTTVRRVSNISLSSGTLSSRISMVKHLRLLLLLKTGSKLLTSV